MPRGCAPCAGFRGTGAAPRTHSMARCPRAAAADAGNVDALAMPHLNQPASLELNQGLPRSRRTDANTRLRLSTLGSLSPTTQVPSRIIFRTRSATRDRSEFLCTRPALEATGSPTSFACPPMNWSYDDHLSFCHTVGTGVNLGTFGPGSHQGRSLPTRYGFPTFLPSKAGLTGDMNYTMI